MVIKNQFTTTPFRPTSYEKTADGFLRVRARVLAERVMDYHPSELSDVPEALQSLPVIPMLVTRETMSTGDSMRTLEGAQVVAPDHTWVEPENAGVSKGNTAGAAALDGPYLVIDLLVTDPATISGVENKEIGEISAGYHAETIFENGEFDGVPYLAKQVQIRFNHIAIIPFESGRAGTDVRIINQKTVEEGEKPMAIRVQLKNTKRFINVESEDDAKAVTEESDASEKEGSKASEGSGKKLEELMAEVEELNSQIAALTEQSEEGKGELSVYKEKLDELLSDEAQEADVEGRVEESGDADAIIENACADMEEKEAEKIKNSFQRVGNTSIHKLRGTPLQTAVLNCVGMKTENMTPGEIKGAFKTHLHMTVTNKGKARTTHVAGAGVFQNKDTAEGKTRVQNQVNKMWGKKA